MKEIKDALEYALMLLQNQANNGKYPELALQENGGKGFQPIINALNQIKNNEDLTKVNDVFFDDKKFIDDLFSEHNKSERENNENGRSFNYHPWLTDVQLKWVLIVVRKHLSISNL